MPAADGSLHESDWSLILVDLGGIGQAIFNQYPRVSFTIDENQSGNASITVSAGSLVGLFSGAQAKIEVKDEHGNWVSVNSIGNNGIIDLIGLGGSKAGITLEDLPAGEYRVMAGASGVGIGTILTVNADVDLFDHTEIGGFDITGVSGNVLDNDAAGEGAKVTHINGEQVGANGTTTFEGEYGTLTIGADGEFTYTPNNTDGSGIGQVETFEYTIKAADGSSSTATIHVRIDSDGQGLIWPEDPSQPAEVDLVANSNTGEAVIDSDYRVTQGGPSQQAPSQNINGSIIGGAVTKTTSITFTVDPNSKADIKITASAPDEKLVTDSLVVTVTGPGGYSKTYTGTGGLFSNLSIQEMLQGLEAGNYTVMATYQRSRGASSGGKLELGYETQSVTHLDEYVVKNIHGASGNVLDDDHLASTYTKFLIKDANGNFVEVSNGTTVEGQHGTLTINTNGSYSYQPKPGLEETGHEDVFEYRLEHPNGTKADATLTVGVEHGDGPYPATEMSAFSADFDEMGADESVLSLDDVEDHTPETTEEPAVLEESIELQGTEDTDVDLGALEDEQEQSGQAAGEPTSFEGISEEELLVPEVDVDPVIDELDEHSLVG
ncbi:Ig-like domain-containing protein [Alcaligenes faecalis]|uniref:Ig-like domain-containing protein n=1 Tax=Alcaligenes faecalis TaxID=511 RepID=UPI001EF11A6E|nr:Ig-like domain-containing protein [Alcaligenes faecalis]ULH08669.1 VCBS domain-containing protein [Alcaligenes faecalis]